MEITASQIEEFDKQINEIRDYLTRYVGGENVSPEEQQLAAACLSLIGDELSHDMLFTATHSTDGIPDLVDWLLIGFKAVPMSKQNEKAKISYSRYLRHEHDCPFGQAFFEKYVDETKDWMEKTLREEVSATVQRDPVSSGRLLVGLLTFLSKVEGPFPELRQFIRSPDSYIIKWPIIDEKTIRRFLQRSPNLRGDIFALFQKSDDKMRRSILRLFTARPVQRNPHHSRPIEEFKIPREIAVDLGRSALSIPICWYDAAKLLLSYHDEESYAIIAKQFPFASSNNQCGLIESLEDYFEDSPPVIFRPWFVRSPDTTAKYGRPIIAIAQTVGTFCLPDEVPVLKEWLKQKEYRFHVIYGLLNNRQEEVRTWFVEWCRQSPDNIKNEVISAMGVPGGDPEILKIFLKTKNVILFQKCVEFCVIHKYVELFPIIEEQLKVLNLPPAKKSEIRTSLQSQRNR